MFLIVKSFHINNNQICRNYNLQPKFQKV